MGQCDLGSSSPNESDTLAGTEEPGTEEQGFSFTTDAQQSEAVDNDLQEIFNEEYLSIEQDFHQQLDRLPDASAISAVGRYFHQLKGAAASIGLSNISQAASYGERMCDESSLSISQIEELRRLAQEVNPQSEHKDNSDTQDKQSMRASFVRELEQDMRQIQTWLNANTLQDHWLDAERILHRLKGSALIVAPSDFAPVIGTPHAVFAEPDNTNPDGMFDKISRLIAEFNLNTSASTESAQIVHENEQKSIPDTPSAQADSQ